MPESVTYALGMTCHLCARKGTRDRIGRSDASRHNARYRAALAKFTMVSDRPGPVIWVTALERLLYGKTAAREVDAFAIMREHEAKDRARSPHLIPKARCDNVQIARIRLTALEST